LEWKELKQLAEGVLCWDYGCQAQYSTMNHKGQMRIFTLLKIDGFYQIKNYKFFQYK
jgi:hypothetical protein